MRTDRSGATSVRPGVPRTLYVVLFLGLALAYYYFFGPGPTVSELSHDLPWWRPAGWALRWHPVSGLAALARAGWPSVMFPILVFCIPPLALCGVGLLLFRAAPMRAALLALGLSLCLFVVYGYVAVGAVWRFFSWHFATAVLGLSSIVAVFVFAPSLLRAVLARPRPAAAMSLLATFATVFVLSTEITGTDASLRANLSPWPALTLFGFLLAGYCLAALHIAAASGIWLRSRWPGALGVAAGTILPALVGMGFCLLIFDRPGLLAFSALGLASALYAGVAGAGTRDPNAAAHSATTRLAAGVLMASFIFVSNRVAISFLDTARNQHSLEVIAALDEYRKTNDSYPDELSELLPRFLEEVPRARMGLIQNKGEEFVYSNFGDSYALEFASVQWVQCAYSPPYAADDDEEEFAGEERGAGPEDVGAGGPPLGIEPDQPMLEGSWSCESAPPMLW